MKRKSIYAFIALLLLSSCQAQGLEAKDKFKGSIEVATLKAKPYKDVKLEKEWVLKDIDPTHPLDIVSMTANKNGVYVLVKNTETKKLPPKKLSEMTKKEREKEIHDMKFFFGRVLNDEERMQKPGSFGQTIELSSYWIQHYSTEGNFVIQWSGADSNKKMVKPKRLTSDESGNIYVAEYGTNKIMKYSKEGKLLHSWKIDDKAASDSEVELHDEGGFAVYKNQYVYAVIRADDGMTLIAMFETNGKLLNLLKPRKDFWIERNMGGQLQRISDKSFQNGAKELLRISDITINEKGQLFILDRELNVICRIDEDGNVIQWYPAVLNEGFDAIILRPMLWKDLKQMGIKTFNTTLKDMHMPMYIPNAISSNGNDIFVSLSGFKPFGIIDAISVDTGTGATGFIKQEKRSEIGGVFGGNNTWDKLVDLNVSMSFYDKYMFLARPVQITEGPGQKRISIIQRYALGGK